ncbi:MAG: glycosyltransferase [Desulfobacter sp.]|nr:MAG: glycosyltransferase [Desulfobacter sp.]
MITSEQGIDIDLLTYGEGQNVDLPGVNIIRIPRFKALGDVKIGPSPLKLFLDIVMGIWTILLLIKTRYNFVHAHEEAVFLCSVLKPIFRFKLLYDMHSSLPQQLSNFQFSSSAALIKIFEILENFSIRQSDAVIAICPDLETYAKSLTKTPDKVVLLENSIFEPVKLVTSEKSNSNNSDKYDRIQRILSSNNMLVLYAGSLESYQGIGMTLEAFKQVLSNQKNIRLMFLGGSKEQVKYYSKMVKKMSLQDEVEFVGSVSKEIVLECTKNASVLISPRSAGTNTPLKIYEQIASGVPLVATNIYSHSQVLNDDVAFLAKPEPYDFAAKIIDALGDKKKREKKACNACRLYEEKYSKMVYKNKMRNLLSKLK